MPATVIRAAAALLGSDLERASDVALVLEDGTITVAGPAAAAPHPAETVYEGDVLLVPGFIDAHVHIGFFDPRDIATNGVTAVRDLGWPAEEIFALAQQSRDPGFAGPLIVAAGPMLTAPGGYPTRAQWAPPGTGRVVATVSEAVAAVDGLVARGAAVIKIALNPPVGPVLDGEIVRAIVEASHARGFRVTAHIYGLEQLEVALDAGVDELAHMLMSPESIPNELIDRMVARGVTVVPTLSIRTGVDGSIAIDNLARFLGAGGRVIYGTDLGNEGPRPGIDPREVAGMAAAGMSARQIIASATVDAARYLGLERKGILGTGWDADIVALDLAADLEPDRLCDVRAVWRCGRRLR